MNIPTLSDVDALYRFSSNQKLVRINISHPPLHRFSVHLDQLIHSLANAEDDIDWNAVLSPLKRLRFALIAAPVPMELHTSLVAASIRIATDRKPVYEKSRPESGSLLAQAIASASTLCESRSNPLLQELALTYPQTLQRSALLLKASWLVPDVEVVLSRHPATKGISVLSANQLRHVVAFPKLVVVGPTRWFPPHVFGAPRADEIVLLNYTFVKDGPPRTPRFVFGWGHTDADDSNGPGCPAKPNAEAITTAEEVDPEDILPRIDFASLHARMSTRSGGETAHDIFSARLAVLEGDYAVYLEDEDSTRVTIVDLDVDDTQDSVRRIPTRVLQPGMFVVLRTDRGGDYVIPVADRILGAFAVKARAFQKQWKDGLRSLASKMTLFELSLRLIDHGSNKANEQNLRNWMSPRSIKTYDRADFAAIMQSIGLGERVDEFWNAMSAIALAHQRAGQYIRSLLIAQLQKTDLTVLEKLGRVDFCLSEGEGGALSAIRVVEIASEVFGVPASKLNTLSFIGVAHAAHATS